MGTVYKARDRESGAVVALKILLQMEHKDRFEREARVLATMEHKHIVRYVAYGVAKTREPWLAMEWLDGEDLGDRLERGPLEIRETLVLGKALAQALSWAHARGFVHRDIKPSNLFLARGEIAKVKLLDFGLARLVNESGAITATGTLMGTLQYMPPEQARDAKRVDARADVFSSGAVLFHALAGCPPFDGATMTDILAKVLAGNAPDVRELRPDTPAPLASLVASMLTHDPRHRPASGTAMLDALAQIVLQPTFDSVITVPDVDPSTRRATVPTDPIESLAEERTIQMLYVPEPAGEPKIIDAATDWSSQTLPIHARARPRPEPAALRLEALPSNVTMRMPSAPALPAPADPRQEARRPPSPRPPPPPPLEIPGLEDPQRAWLILLGLAVIVAIVVALALLSGGHASRGSY
jgi:serine/threonine protein kinase